MKRFILLIAMAMTISYGFAQEMQRGPRNPHNFNPEQMATRQADRIKETCGINDEQYAQLKAHFLKRSEEMQKMFQNRGEGQDVPRMTREDMEKRREAETVEIKKILTEEQFAKYEEMQRQMQQRRRSPRQ